MKRQLGLRERIHHVTGPYLNTVVGSNAFGRRLVMAHYHDGDKCMVSYPKFLVEFLLDRELDPKEETIDHLDGDFNNNVWDNLRIIDLATHVAQECKTAPSLELACVWCGQTFQRTLRVARESQRRNKAGPFCSKRCSGQYSTAVQHGKIAAYTPQTVPDGKVVPQVKRGGIKVSDLPQAKAISENDILLFIKSTRNKSPRDSSRTKINARNKRSKKAEVSRGTCPVCGVVLPPKVTKYCSKACHEKSYTLSCESQLPVEKQVLQKLLWEVPATKLCLCFGISVKTLAKWCKSLKLDTPSRGYWNDKRF